MARHVARKRLLLSFASILLFIGLTAQSCSTTTTLFYHQVYHTPSGQDIIIELSKIEPPELLHPEELTSYIAVKLVVGSFTLDTNDPKFQCLEDIANIVLLEEKANPISYIIAGYDCSQVQRGPPSPAVRPLVASRATARNLYKLFSYTGKPSKTLAPKLACDPNVEPCTVSAESPPSPR
jgi:hypothetical protein